jgi:hypothetical protein
MKMLRTKNQEEREALKAVLGEIGAEWGFAKSFGLSDLLRKWKRFVVETEEGYQLSICDFTHDLWMRDLLEQVKEAVPVRLRQELDAEIEPWDKRFLLATEPSVRPIEPVDGAREWWFRIPRISGQELSEIDREIRHLAKSIGGIKMTNMFMRISSGFVALEIKAVEIIEADDPVRERSYEIFLDHRFRSEISFLEFYRPSVAMQLPFVFVWGGSRLFRMNSEDGLIEKLLDDGDEILAVYPLGENWCVVGEISLRVYNSLFSEVKWEYSFEEIVLECWWEAGKLCISDLQKASFIFLPNEEMGTLVLAPATV